MGFQLSNDDDTSSTINPTATTTNSSDFNSYSDTDFNPEEPDTVFIADRYHNQAPVDQMDDYSSVSYIKQTESFPPYLMFLGVVFQILSIVTMINAMNNGALSLTDPSALSSASGNSALLNLFAVMCFVVDGIILYRKKMCGVSIIVWAIIFPVVYYFKRCKANDNTSLFAWGITLVLIVSSVFYVQSTINATFEAAGIDINASGIQGAALASNRIPLLSTYGIGVHGYGCIYYNQIIAYNIIEPRFEYIEESDGAPALLRIKGTTNLRGTTERIQLNLNYSTMAVHSIVVGDNTYSDALSINEYLYYLCSNVPIGGLSQ